MLSDIEFKQKVERLLNKLKSQLFDEVINDAKVILKKRKDQIIYNILSLAFINKGEYKNSIDLLKKALKNEPNNIFYLNNLGLSYHKNGDAIQSEESFKRALEINPKYINTLNNYGNLKKDLELIEDSIILYNKALSFDPNVLETNYNLGSAYQSIGKFKESINHLNKVLEINPNFTIADRNISLMTKYDSNNEHLKKMKLKVKDGNLTKAQLVELYFGIGKALDDIDDYENSFSNIFKANNLKKELSNYNIKKDINLFTNIKKKFKNKTNLKFDYNKRKFIFIVGLPRSGTTLVEQIISSHPKVFGAGELIFLHEIKKEFFDKSLNLEIVNEKDKLDEIRKYYLRRTSLINDTNENLTDKAPLNFRWIGFINLMFPNSKIIHCRRDPLENCWSIYKNNFDGSLNFSNNLSDLGKFYEIYNDLMNFWKTKCPESIYDLYYENLVSDQENEIKKLINFCEINWDPICLKYYENPKSIKTVSAVQARQPIYNTSIKKSANYKKYLKELISYIKK